MANPSLREQVLRAIVEGGDCEGHDAAEWCWSRGPDSACRCVKTADRVMALVGDRVFSVAQAEALVAQAFREAGGIPRG